MGRTNLLKRTQYVLFCLFSRYSNSHIPVILKATNLQELGNWETGILDIYIHWMVTITYIYSLLRRRTSGECKHVGRRAEYWVGLSFAVWSNSAVRDMASETNWIVLEQMHQLITLTCMRRAAISPIFRPMPGITGDTEKFSAKENFQKSLKVYCFYLRSWPDKDNDKIKIL